MIGRSRPVVGAETRICRSTRRPGTDTTTGLTEMTGVGVLTGYAFGFADRRVVLRDLKIDSFDCPR